MTTTTKYLVGMDAPKVTRLPGVVVTLFLILMSGLTAHAAAPVMTLPSSVTIPEDEATNLVFSVSDTDSPLFAVTITAKSSNTDLVPNSGLAPSGAGSTRFLAITPGLHKYGSSTITVIATDDALESSTNTFTLNVTFTNYPPTFSSVATNRTIREDAGSTNILFAIGDVETALSNLTVTATSTNTTLIPNGNLVLSGTAVNRKKTQRLMRKMGIEGMAPGPSTSKRHPKHKVYPYLLRDFVIERPNQVWSSDITYIPLRRGFL